MKTQQKWQCPVCKHEYRSAIPVSEVLCPTNHLPSKGRSARGVMKLIEGEFPRPRKMSAPNRKPPVGISDPSPKRSNRGN